MNLFFKIFLWFLAAIALMIGVIMFLNWTIQTEPVVSRWQVSIRNQTGIYADTAGQIYEQQGMEGLRTFIDRLRVGTTITEIDIVGKDGSILFADVADLSGYQQLVGQTFQSGDVELELNSPDSALAARKFQTASGAEYSLIIRWTRPQPVQVFGETRLRYARWIGLLITALIVCYILALYLTSPIRKLREAAQRLADGELDTRVADRVGRRGDELSGLARDFDVMAERIESLITSQKTLSRDISHELRSPLARLNVALEIAKKKANNETHPSLERIETESNRLNEMIGRLLTLSRLETGTDDFERTQVNLRKLVEQVSADAEFEAAAKGRSVKVVKLDECSLKGSESLLRSAVENVLRNALKYTQPETMVEVELEARNGDAKITIRDHGGGVPEDQLKNLFRPFYRVGEARDRGSGGTGLGLAITEQAVHAHAGTVTARNVNGGLEVEIKLPLNGGHQ